MQEPDDDSNHERRQSSRYEPLKDEILLGWNSPQGFQTVRAQILNISSGGLALRDQGEFPEATAVWATTAAAGHEWTPVNIAGNGVDSLGSATIRLKFPNDCPYDLFRSAVFGFASPSASAEPQPESSTGLAASFQSGSATENFAAPKVAAAVPAWSESRAFTASAGDPAGQSGLRAVFGGSRRFRWGD